MKIDFHKYQGTGNDFVILDNREGNYADLAIDRIKLLCDRRFGIEVDGLLLLNKQEGYDFEMV
jgi:diaminopimelate epimerase